MATTTVNYAGAAGTAVTWTLTSGSGLANGSWRQSDAVDNTSNKYMDALVGGSIQTGTTPTVNTTIDIYAFGQYDGSAEFTAGAGASDAVYTADGEEGLLKFVTSIVVDADSDIDYEWGPIAIAPVFGGVLPQRWGLVCENNTGAALNGTGTNNELLYTGIKFDTA
jgi:hypothetical protein